MEENKLAYPQKLDINSFPKEQKKKHRKKGWRPIRRMRRRYKDWKAEQKWKRAQRRRKIPFGEKVLIFVLGPIADFLDDIRNEKERKKTLNIDKRPNIFKRLYWMIIENREESKQSKQLSRKIRKSLAFDVEQDKRVFNLKDEWLHMKATWKNMPWDRSREIENMIITTIVIVLAFSFNYLVIQGAKYGIASFFGIPASWESGKIVFNIPDPSPLWTYSSVLSVYISGPLLVFTIGMLFLHFHLKTKDKSSLKALIFLWTYLTAFLLFFGTYIAGIFTDRGFGYVMGWLFIPKYIEIPLGLFFLFMIWMVGFSSGKKLISFAPNMHFYTSVLPQLFFKMIYIYIPAILALSILLAIGFNNRDFTIQIVYLGMIGMLTPTLRFIPEKMN